MVPLHGEADGIAKRALTVILGTWERHVRPMNEPAPREAAREQRSRASCSDVQACVAASRVDDLLSFGNDVNRSIVYVSVIYRWVTNGFAALVLY